jgi:site-specific recombinase XerD
MSQPLDELRGSFHRHLRAEGRADRTIKIYDQAVRFFADWLVAQGRAPVKDELTRDAIVEWLASLAERGQEPGTRQMRHRGLYRFCGWLVDEEELPKHPMAGLRQPEPRERPVDVVTDAELAALLKACTGKRFYDRRDEVVIRLLNDTGCRVSEICGLDLEVVDLEQMLAPVTGKGGKVRIVYWGARTARALDRYLRMRAKHRHATHPRLLLGERGPLTPDGVRELVRVRAEAAGIGHKHPHQLRHTWAADLKAQGMSEDYLERLGGWAKGSVMTRRYGEAAADRNAALMVRRLNRGDRV